jgi:hypothetical protein
MRNTAGNFIHMSLNRRPVLAAMMVYSVGFGAAALMAAVAVWRANSSCPLSQRTQQPYVVQVVRGVAGPPDPAGQPGSIAAPS